MLSIPFDGKKPHGHRFAGSAASIHAWCLCALNRDEPPLPTIDAYGVRCIGSRVVDAAGLSGIDWTTRSRMTARFEKFLWGARWAGAVVALMYHVRYLQFVDYGALTTRGALSTVFYVLTGLGHEAFAVFFVADGIAAGSQLWHGHGSMYAVPGRPAGLHPGALSARALYAQLLPGLLLGVCFDHIGARFLNGSGIYTSFPEFSTLTLGTSALLGNAFMLQPFFVPTFGSNGMLYLLSYLFWSRIPLALFVRAAAKPGGAILRVLLVTAVGLVMPAQFLHWGAIWLTGVATSILCAARTWRPTLPTAMAGFAGALLLSRIVGSNTGLLPAPFGAWLVHYKYDGVGLGFAVLAAALYPVRVPAFSAGTPGYLASFTFFFHFPVVMLLFACSSALLRQPLMRQPTPLGYAGFAIASGLCFALTAMVARASAVVLDPIYIRIIPLLKSISLRKFKRE
jgi:hypothetical protein